MVYGDNGDNNGESLILLLLFEGIHTFLAFWNFVRRIRCSSFSFLSGGYLVPLILLSDTCPFLPLVSLFLFFRGSGHLSLFIFSYYYFFLLFFFRALISWDNIASGSNKITWAFISQKYFWPLSPGLGVEYFWWFWRWKWVDICGWYFWCRSNMCEWTCKWNLDLTTWQAPKGLHSLTTLNAHKQ